MTLAELKQAVAAGREPRIEVHALEQVLYVAFAADRGRLRPLTDARHRSLQFPSRFRALQALARTGLARVEVVHRSSYGEMIGTPGNAELTEMRETLSLERWRDA